MEFDSLSHRIIGAAIEVHRALGPGLLESTYERCLAHELTQLDIPYALQVTLPVKYKGIELDCGYRVDVLVGSEETPGSRVLVELKAADEILPIHEAQLLTYMRMSNVRIGILINFNVRLLKDGMKRMVL